MNMQEEKTKKTFKRRALQSITAKKESNTNHLDERPERKTFKSQSLRRKATNKPENKPTNSTNKRTTNSFKTNHFNEQPQHEH